MTRNPLRHMPPRRGNPGSTHWEGCEQEHHECALAQLADQRATVEKLEREHATLVAAVNESTDECSPACDKWGHDDKCPRCDPARWLADQQKELATLKAAQGRLVAALKQAGRRLKWQSNYEKNPPEIIKDDFAYDRLLLHFQDEAKRWLVDVHAALAAVSPDDAPPGEPDSGGSE